jgi:hypothetical protein
VPEKYDFDAVFSKLREILKPYEPKLVVTSDTPNHYSLDTRHVMKNKKPLYFAGVKKGKNYVSYYLMSVYATPGLIKEMSPELRSRMQGKACFNFKTVDEELFEELAGLTKAGFSRFHDKKFLDSLRNLQ